MCGIKTMVVLHGWTKSEGTEKHENVGFSLVFKAIMALCDS